MAPMPMLEGSSEMQELLHDVFAMHDNWEDEGGSQMGVEAGVVQQEEQGPIEDAKKFFDLLKQTEEPLWSGCTKHNIFSAIVGLFNLKCEGGWSNASFTKLLRFLKDIVPSDAKLPNDTYEAKKFIKDLGLGYEKIPACPNGCMLFWKDNEKLERCTKCDASKWKQTKNGGDDSRRLRKWHADKRTKDGVLRHPADGLAWKEFDERYPEFASDPRNVRLGLSSDGFNPFGNMSTSHSTWPVMLIPYNLPPWMCMKQPSQMLSLIIRGPHSPGMKIDVYLEPLISELKELWDVGLSTYDASSKSNFTMRAALMWTINDFPAYGDLSGWSTKGRAACPCCMGNTWSKRLRNGKIFCFMGHRRWLPMDHSFRMDNQLFDGTQEMDPLPIVPNGDEIMSQLEEVDWVADHRYIAKKQNIVRTGPEMPIFWKKKSIFFALPYWKDNLLRHNLDVMHIEKNVVDNIIARYWT
ncbi:uncharacterized protein LOC133876141 [Alnus glutinosa]|uniref:uncharacterized protein LOC133876141 n=1 Tax=Alnus glutinosa TaxID=3517 RepID=UPI002D785904|nr:uncharacterized protein LOC133876141 [Alnus glutinosa]